MEKILFIHGLGSDKNSDTGKMVKEILKDYGTVDAETYNLTDLGSTFRKIYDKINYEDYTMVIGHSFGGFYTLLTNTFSKKLKKIVINPCVLPSVEIPKLTTVDPTFRETFEEYEQYFSPEFLLAKADDNFGIFGRDDPLFSYRSLYNAFFNNCGNTAFVPGEHKLSFEELENALDVAMQYFGINPETRLEERTDRKVEVQFEDTAEATDFKNEMEDRFGVKSKSKYQVPVGHGRDGGHVYVQSNFREERLQERFVNIFTKKPEDFFKLQKYKQTVYDMIQNGYKSIGGAAGLGDVDDLVNDSDFWKLNLKNGKVEGVVVYTMKRGGRKVQYLTADPSEEGKQALYDIIKDDCRLKDREAWAEVSGKVEHIYRKYGEATPVLAKEVEQLLYDKNDIQPDPTNKFYYFRHIGDPAKDENGNDIKDSNLHQKITMGNLPKYFFKDYKDFVEVWDRINNVKVATFYGDSRLDQARAFAAKHK